MGNFFSQYRPDSHSCAPQGSSGAGTRKAYHTGPLLRQAVQFPRVDKACSSDDQVTKPTKQRLISKSYPTDPSKAGFLDLPGELRNDVYTQLFIVEGYVRITSNGKAWTKVSALALLRTCKQVHDEAASVFYRGNSFYCNLKKFLNVPEDIAPAGDTKTLVSLREQLQSHVKLDIGGVLFPAPRYQRWLTRITIDIEVHIRNPWLYLTFDYSKPQHWQAELDKSDASRKDMHDALLYLFGNQYEKMKSLWAEKDIQWKGKFVADNKLNNAGTSQHMYRFLFSFFEDENEMFSTRDAVWSCNMERPIGQNAP